MNQTERMEGWRCDSEALGWQEGGTLKGRWMDVIIVGPAGGFPGRAGPGCDDAPS